MKFSLYGPLIYLSLILWILPIEGFSQNYQIWPQGEKPILGQTPSAESKLKIKMVHNEFEIALINLPQFSQKNELTKIKNIKLKWITKSPQIKWNFYYLADHKINQSSFSSKTKGTFLDIVIPSEKVSHDKFKIPAENIPSTPWFLIEFFNEANSLPGDYEGELSFDFLSTIIRIPLHLHLHSYSLPNRFDLKTSFGFAPWSVLKKHYGGWNEKENELYEKYFELAQDHRIDLHKIYTSFPETKHENKVDLNSEKYKNHFLIPWMKIYQGNQSQHALKGSITDLPVSEEMKSEIDEKKLEFWKSLNQSVINNNLLESTYVYYADEPDKTKLIEIKNSLSKLRKEKISLNMLVTHHYVSSLDKLINWWCINYHQWDQKGFPTVNFYEERVKKNKNEKIWLYSSCNSHGCSGAENNYEPDFTFDRPSAFLRSFPWLAALYGIDGILYYDTVLGYNRGDMSPWKDEFNFTGWGEGNLFYPCNEKFCGNKDQYPLASLRLKILRDGLEDAQIIKDSIKRNRKNEEILKSILKGPRSFPLTTVEYDKFKFLD